MNLKDLRKNSGMTIDEMAKEIGRNRATVSKIENFRDTAKYGDVRVYLDVLGYELRILIKQ